MSNLNQAKEAAAKAALHFIKEGMVVGLGTGSTAKLFISHLGDACQKGLNIRAVATSEQSAKQAKEVGIPLIDINTLTTIDIDVDGADEINPQKQLIKGGGGAAFREKIVASMSQEFIVIADESKLVTDLGKFPLPLEILPFGHAATIAKLQEKGYIGQLRKNPSSETVVTDNGNYIFDVALPYPCTSPENEDKTFKKITGVIETGFFINLASRVIIGYADGSTKIL